MTEKQNKKLMVIGASSDMGTALISKIEGNYDKIYAHYLHEKPALSELKNKLGEKLVLLQADLEDKSSIEEKILKPLREQNEEPCHIVYLPSLKIFIERFHKSKSQDFKRGMQISVYAAVQILQEYMPRMAKQKYGKVVMMLTANVLNNPPGYQSVYVTHKYALLGLMKSLAAEYASKNITVNGVSPDMIETDFLSELPELVIAQNAQNGPTGRNLQVSDVVPAFEYLLSDEADAVTGVNIPITGGR